MLLGEQFQLPLFARFFKAEIFTVVHSSPRIWYCVFEDKGINARKTFAETDQSYITVSLLRPILLRVLLSLPRSDDLESSNLRWGNRFNVFFYFFFVLMEFQMIVRRQNRLSCKII